MRFTILIAIILLFASCDKIVITPNNSTLNNPFIDLRDGQEYGTVTIDGMRWMASNLRFTDVNHRGDTLSYDKNTPPFYGKYYDTDRMLTICPPGWHLPSDAEWTQLEEYILGRPLTASDSSSWLPGGIIRGNYANKLKNSGNDWGGEGTDEYGLNILAAGSITFNVAEPITGTMVTYMTSTPSPIINKYYFRSFRYGEEGVIREVFTLGTGMITVKKAVCRCIEN